MDKKNIDQIEYIIKIFVEVKDACSKLYRKLENANTKDECDELIKLYKEIVYKLKIIKEQSRVLDNVEVNEDFLGTDDEINEIRENNSKSIECLAQQIRGCMQSFQKLIDILKNQKVQD